MAGHHPMVGSRGKPAGLAIARAACGNLRSRPRRRSRRRSPASASDDEAVRPGAGRAGRSAPAAGAPRARAVGTMTSIIATATSSAPGRDRQPGRPERRDRAEREDPGLRVDELERGRLERARAGATTVVGLRARRHRRSARRGRAGRAEPATFIASASTGTVVTSDAEAGGDRRAPSARSPSAVPSDVAARSAGTRTSRPTPTAGRCSGPGVTELTKRERRASARSSSIGSDA